MAPWHIGLQLHMHLRKHRNREPPILQARLAATDHLLLHSHSILQMRKLTRVAMGWRPLWEEATSLSTDPRRRLHS
jgi:hypothetical protein